MSEHSSQFVRTLVERGYLYQATNLSGLDDAAAGDAPLIGYIGFDCTAPSLHAGSMVQIMMLRRLQQAGGKPIVLIGGGTTKIGDPSDKDKQRPLLDQAAIDANKEGIRKVFSKFLTFGDGPSDALMVDNAEWLDALEYIDFLRDYGKHFTINRMIQLESVKRRLDREQPLTFLEFNYMLLQAYDFLELNRRYGCTLQMGGSDQWGNIVNGADLIRRAADVEAFGVTTPLLATASGAKMGKTADGAVWLSADMLGAYEFWQYWRNAEDADVGRFLRLFTDVPLDEIAELEKADGAAINDVKVRLANEVTTLVHNAEAAKEAEETAKQVFSGGVSAGLPTISVSLDGFEPANSNSALFVDAGLVASKGEFRRKLAEGAIRVDDVVIDDLETSAIKDALAQAGQAKLSVGKKRHALVKTA